MYCQDPESEQFPTEDCSWLYTLVVPYLMVSALDPSLLNLGSVFTDSHQMKSGGQVLAKQGSLCGGLRSWAHRCTFLHTDDVICSAGSLADSLFLSMLRCLGPYCFFVYAGIAFCGGAFCYLKVPETKCCTLLEVQERLKGKPRELPQTAGTSVGLQGTEIVAGTTPKGGVHTVFLFHKSSQAVHAFHTSCHSCFLASVAKPHLIHREILVYKFGVDTGTAICIA